MNGILAEAFALLEGNTPLYGGSGTNEKLAQSFKLKSGLPSYEVESVAVWVRVYGSTVTDDLTLTLCPDSNGSPDESNPIATAESISLAVIGNDGWHVPRFVFSSNPVLQADTTYWIVLARTGSRDTTYYPYFGRSSSTTYYTYGIGKRRDNGSWVSNNNHFCFMVFCKSPAVRVASAASYDTSYYRALYGGTGTYEQLAQGFRVQASCSITGVRLRVGIYGSGQPADNLKLELRENNGGLPTGSLIAESLEVKALHCRGNGWYEFVFASPVAVSAGTDYFMVLKRTGGRDTGNYNIWFCLPTSQVAPSSAAYKTALYRDNGTWTQYTNYAFQFMIYGLLPGFESAVSKRLLHVYCATNTGQMFAGGTGSNQRVAQGFTLTESAQIKVVRIAVGRYAVPTDEVILKIYNDNSGVPGSQVSGAASWSIEGRGLTNAGGTNGETADSLFTEFVFSDPVQLSAGTQYYLVLERTGSYDGSNYYYMYRNNRGSGVYGETYDCTYYQSGGAWTRQGSYDTCFALWELQAPSDARLDAAGDITAARASRLEIELDLKAGRASLTEWALTVAAAYSGASHLALDVPCAARSFFDWGCDLTLGSYGLSELCALDVQTASEVHAVWNSDIQVASRVRADISADLTAGYDSMFDASVELRTGAGKRFEIGSHIEAALARRHPLVCEIWAVREGRTFSTLDLAIGKSVRRPARLDLQTGAVFRYDVALYIETSHEYRHPRVAAHAPGHGLTGVPRSGKLSVLLEGWQGHPIDLQGVSIFINGEELDLLSDRISFKTFDGDQRVSIEASYGPMEYEQLVTVVVRARSTSGYQMPDYMFKFTTEAPLRMLRGPLPRVELYLPGEYDVNVLTIQEDFCRAGEERITAVLELWYGYGQPEVHSIADLLLYVESKPGTLAAELLASGCFRAKKEDDPDFTSVTPQQPFSLGRFNANSKKNLHLSLSVPGNIAAGGLMQFTIKFVPVRPLVYGRVVYGRCIYGEIIPLEGIYPNTVIYRASIYTDEMWNELAGLLRPHVLLVGEDKQL